MNKTDTAIQFQFTFVVMEKTLNEEGVLALLQGHWQPEGGLPAFKIIKRNVIIDGDIIGIGIPGMDNNTSMPLLLKWNTDVEQWQLFIHSLGWLCTFIDDVTESSFTVSSYDTTLNTFEEPVKVNRYVESK